MTTGRKTVVKVIGHRGRQHRKLRGLIKMFTDSGRWDSVTVERAERWAGQRHDLFHVFARRDVGTLASTYIYVAFVATARGRIHTAHRYAALGRDKRLSGWSDIRIWASI